MHVGSKLKGRRYGKGSHLDVDYVRLSVIILYQPIHALSDISFTAHLLLKKFHVFSCIQLSGTGSNAYTGSEYESWWKQKRLSHFH
jgi:hypothetical protein